MREIKEMFKSKSHALTMIPMCFIILSYFTYDAGIEGFLGGIFAICFSYIVVIYIAFVSSKFD